MSILDNCVTPEEAARILNKSQPSVYRYLRDGLLPFVDDRGRKFIPREALEGFSVARPGNPNFQQK